MLTSKPRLEPSIIAKPNTGRSSEPFPEKTWKELVGKIAAEIKMFKPVEPYKGKGIKERGQYILRKEGKKQ